MNIFKKWLVFASLFVNQGKSEVIDVIDLKWLMHEQAQQKLLSNERNDGESTA